MPLAEFLFVAVLAGSHICAYAILRELKLRSD